MRSLNLCLVLAAGSILLAGADWRRFRGPNGSGVAQDEIGVPSAWGQGRNIAWKAKLPGRGASGPIVIGDRVVVTCSSGYRQDHLHVVCFDIRSGAARWERQFWATGSSMTHPKICPATATPVSDGQRLFAHFSTSDLVCLDLDGNLLWLRGLQLQYPNVRNSLGLASSPVVVDDTLVVKMDTDTQSVALGLDAASGQTRWQNDRAPLASWDSPVPFRGDDERVLVVMQSGGGLTAYEPDTGRPAWHWGHSCSTIPSCVADRNRLLVPSDGLVALSRPSGDGGPSVIWQNGRLNPSTSSPLCYRGRVYVVSRSVLKCADAETGRLLWQLRLEGSFSSSPVVAADRLYLFNEEGLGQVIAVGSSPGRVVGEGDLGETILCTPAISGGALYVRSDDHLWKIARTP
jgi:outer membrane protein assembly factor BamB